MLTKIKEDLGIHTQTTVLLKVIRGKIKTKADTNGKTIRKEETQEEDIKILLYSLFFIAAFKICLF